MSSTREPRRQGRATWISLFSVGCVILMGVSFLPGCLQDTAHTPGAADPWIVVTPTAVIVAAVGLGLTSLTSPEKRAAVAMTFLSTIGLLASATAGVQAMAEAW